MLERDAVFERARSLGWRLPSAGELSRIDFPGGGLARLPSIRYFPRKLFEHDLHQADLVCPRQPGDERNQFVDGHDADTVRAR